MVVGGGGRVGLVGGGRGEEKEVVFKGRDVVEHGFIVEE